MESYPLPSTDGYPYKYIDLDYEIKDKVTAISAFDNIVAFGTDGGYVYSFEVKETATGTGSKYTFEENSQKSKRGNDIIRKIQIIPVQYYICLLVDKNFFMISMDSLSTEQEIKTKEIKNNVYMFAIKNKNDTIDEIDPFDISLAIATNKNVIFWKFNQDFRFEEEKLPSTGDVKKFNIGDKVYGMEWIENTIYIGTRSSYFIMNTNTGAIVDVKLSPPLKDPQIGVINDKQVVLMGKGNKICYYNHSVDKTSLLCDDMTGEGFKIVVHNMNIIIMSDREIKIYNFEKNKLLQDFGKITDISARYTAIGSKKYDVIIAYNPNPSNRKQSRTLLKILKEAPIEQQIEKFLRMGEEKEAQRIFFIENKGKPNLEELKREFELNTGWIKFYERLEYDNSINNLINGNIDPRELLITFGYHNYISAVKDCLIKLPKTSIYECIKNYIIINKIRIDEIESLRGAKESLLSIIMNIHRELSHFDSDRIIKFNLCAYSENYKNFKDEK